MNEEILLSMDSLPDAPETELNEADSYEVTITRAERTVAKSGAIMLQMDLDIEGTDKNIRYDNTVIQKSDGKMNQPGTYKLKRLLEATGTVIEGGFKIQLAATLLKGKSFITKLAKKETLKGTTVFELGHPKFFEPSEDTVTKLAEEVSEEEIKENTEPGTIVITEQPQLETPNDEIISTEDW